MKRVDQRRPRTKRFEICVRFHQLPGYRCQFVRTVTASTFAVAVYRALRGIWENEAEVKGRHHRQITIGVSRVQ